MPCAQVAISVPQRTDFSCDVSSHPQYHIVVVATGREVGGKKGVLEKRGLLQDPLTPPHPTPPLALRCPSHLPHPTYSLVYMRSRRNGEGPVRSDLGDGDDENDREAQEYHQPSGGVHTGR